MEKCKYCQDGTNDFIRLNDTSEYSGIEISINRQGMLRARSLRPDGTMDSQDIVRIERCPRCGRGFGR